MPVPSPAQDAAAISMRARINLYDNWNFDSVAYYHDQVIGKKYCPAFAYSDHGWYLMLTGDRTEALAMIRKAALMDPSYTQMSTWYAWALLWEKRLTEASEWIGKALNNDPSDAEALFVASLVASTLEDHTGALDYAKKAAQIDPMWRAGIPLALAMADRTKEAVTSAQSLENNANAYDAMLLAETYTAIGNHDKALGFLELAFELRHPFMPWITHWPGIQPLSEEARFKDLVSKMNLPD